ncbi:alpha/beta fold hydrolase [Halopseudomonas maritima]|uniref:alpha/beta fold hydrolase n=1 Tax=Halopseudomonas maritima TaxID=2918528 RepID=UPI001EEBFD68|nr:alpha/beta hydrolase [Halopseudomonas maritima]UJJ31016.1 alpha/beta hydrolase [Halopseudomonas maritima]
MLNTLATGSGPTLVWAHGLTYSMQFESQTGWFHPAEDVGIQRLRFDARGHGLSPVGSGTQDYRWSAQAADMLDVARSQTLAPVALGGQSMGSAAALLAALQRPQEVTCLILATPPCVWQKRPSQVQRYRQMQRLLQQRGIDNLIALAKRYPALPAWLLEAHPEHANAGLQAMAQISPDSLMDMLEAACQCDLPPPDILQALQIPTLILAWRDDPIHPLLSAEQLAANLPQAQLQVIDSAAQLADWPRQISEFVRQHA